MSEHNKAVLRGFLQDCITKGDPDAVDRYIAEDYLDHDRIPGFPPGREGERLGLRAFHDAFSDLDVVIEDVIAEGDTVVTRSTLSGRHTADFFGIPASGKELSWTSMDITRVRDGLMVEHWALSNLMDQLAGGDSA